MSQDSKSKCSKSFKVASGRYLFLFYICPGFDLGGQVAIGFSHWRSPLTARGQNLPSLDCVHSEASAIPPISEHPEPASCPASLSITPLPTLHSSQETLSDSSTGTYMHISQTPLSLTQGSSPPNQEGILPLTSILFSIQSK